MDIIYEDNNMMVINKPSGKLTQSGKSFDVDLVSEVCTYRKEKGEEIYAAVINRLDRPVSGLVLIAKNKKSAGELSRLMQNEGFCKKYSAVVVGKMESEEGVLEDYLLKDGKTNMSVALSPDTAAANKEAKLAKLRYKVVDTFADKAGRECQTLEIELLTGRHHQIRCQLSSRGHTIVGDVKYGDDKSAAITSGIVKRNQIALCAVSLEVKGKIYEVTPDWMK